MLACFRSLQRELNLAVVLVHHTRKNAAGGASAGLGLRGSSDIHAVGGSNLYLRRTSDRLMLSSEHRAAAAARSIYLELISDPADQTHLSVTGDVGGQKRRDVQERTLELLTEHGQLTRAKLRELLAVKNEWLGEALESLQQAGRIRRTTTGWQPWPPSGFLIGLLTMGKQLSGITGVLANYVSNEPQREPADPIEKSKTTPHFDRERRANTTKTSRETEAEAVAYVVGRSLGLDALDHCADYIQLYDGDAEVFAKSMECIQKTAMEILKGVHEYLAAAAPRQSEAAA
ncbi:MAG: hypothetical protein KDA60_17485 [Planctomycetales bacterium]|nr:hypothetical protein [Planctomycetales bacterium]